MRHHYRLWGHYYCVYRDYNCGSNEGGIVTVLGTPLLYRTHHYFVGAPLLLGRCTTTMWGTKVDSMWGTKVGAPRTRF